MDAIQFCYRLDTISRFVSIEKRKTVKDLYDVMRTKIPGGTNLNFYLMAMGDIILDENSSASLESLIRHHFVTLDMCVRLIQAEVGRSKLLSLPGFIEVTTSPCSISYDDNPAISRAKFPCGCVIDPTELKRYCDTCVNEGKSVFPCPICGDSWKLEWIQHVLSAVSTENEMRDFNCKLNDNFIANMQHIKKCPTCHNFLERDQTKRYMHKDWVRCPLCTSRKGENVEFCWICLKPWKGDKRSCGNEGCNGIDPQVQYLQTCDTKTIGKVVGVPSVRSCVKCGNLINHKDKCKHMTCRCGYAFCFICLKPKISKLFNNGWQCGGPYAPCKVAPRQQRLNEITEQYGILHTFRRIFGFFSNE